jgi:hypothetical protein
MTTAGTGGSSAGRLGDPYGVTSRRLIYISAVAILVVCGGTAIHSGHWRWWLFGWGVAIGLLSAVMYGLLLRVVPAMFHLGPERTAQAQPRLSQMKRAVYPLVVTIGVALGALASGLASPWPDVLLSVGVVVFQIAVPMAMLPMLRRRVRSSNT